MMDGISSETVTARCDLCQEIFTKSQITQRFCSKRCGKIFWGRELRSRSNPNYRRRVVGVCQLCGGGCESYVCKPCKNAAAKERTKRYREIHGRSDRKNFPPKGVCRKCGGFCKFYVCDVCQYDVIRQDRKKHRKRLQGVESEPYTSTEIAERDGWRCQLCGKAVNKRLKYPNEMSASIDHIIPISKGGTDLKVNVQLTHLFCNISKGNRVTDNGEQLRLLG
jgi:hypothetical protein